MVCEAKKLKERSLYIYLPSVNMAEDWKKKADNEGQSLSKFVVEHVLDSLKEEDGSDHSPRSELAKQLRDTQEDLKKVSQEAKLYRQLAEKFDTDLKYYRTQPFLDQKFQGIREYDQELIEILKKKGNLDSDRLLEELNIDPKQLELVRGIRNQLDNLERYGLIQSTPRGWKWVG